MRIIEIERISKNETEHTVKVKTHKIKDYDVLKPYIFDHLKLPDTMAPFRHSFGSSTATGDAAFIASFAVSVASASMGETAQKADVLMNGEDDAISMIESTLLRCSSLFTLDILESLSDELMHSLLASLLSVEQQRKQRPSSRASRASSRILALLVHRDGILAVVFSLLIIPG